MRLMGKLAVITGGGGGIGKAITTSFLDEGAKVVMVDKESVGKRDEVRTIISLYGVSACFMGVDISNSSEVNTMASEIYQKFNQMDILVNCAGIYEQKMMLEMSDDEWDRTLRSNLYGTFFCSRAIALYMKKRMGGCIINISSIGAQMAPSDGHAHYAASKAGMIGFSRAIARELAPFGIRVNNICPGATKDTPMWERVLRNVGEQYFERVPLGRPATPLDIAHGAVYLASSEADYVTGATISINGGLYMN